MEKEMKKSWLLSAEEMKEADRTTIEYFGVPSCVLMERAALGVAEEIAKRFKRGGRVLILAGCGNNGGDGAAAGRILLQQGYAVDLVLVGKREKCSRETARQLAILEKYGCPVESKMKDQEYDIVVDALFGIGLSRPVEGIYAQSIRAVNERKAFVCAVDLPSGIHTDTGKVMGEAVRADLTVSFGFEKLGHVLYPGCAYTGELVLKDIGITQDSLLQGNRRPLVYTYRGSVKDGLPVRNGGGNKGTFGKALVIAGSVNMSGACELCAGSAYRTGAGMVRVMTPQENRVILQKNLPEALLTTYSVHEDGDSGEKDGEGLIRQLDACLAWADCVLAGPGLGMGRAAALLVEQLLVNTELPLILDADALNRIAESETLKEALAKRKGPVILTPHVAECARLCGAGAGEIKEHLISRTRALSEEFHCVAVCKDARTAVAFPGEEAVYLNTTGNDGMATAGSGDVLSGIITGLVAQGMEASAAAALGVYVHGLAGDRAAGRMGRYALMAGDIKDELRAVLR